MPLTFVHLGINFFIYWIVSLISPVEFKIINLFYLALAELIDFDHLFSKPVYHPKRNPFKVHFIHKNWKFVIFLSLILIITKEFMFVGFGLLSHLFIDYIYTKYILKLE